MTISDEKLSAFLDAELPESEMESIRQCISEDETLANRLAELAVVDEQVAQHYAAIDSRPLPDAITHLLTSASAAAPTQASATIIPFRLWKKIQRGLQQHAAVAACTALVLGFGLAQLLPGSVNTPMGNWSAIASALDTAPSGTEQELPNDTRIKPRLTFVNEQGQYCRQFSVSDQHISAENIACRVNDKWEPNLTVYAQATSRGNDYQTATNSNVVLDQALDNMMHGDAFDATAESNIIQRGWKKD